jgi:hypothetical protein
MADDAIPALNKAMDFPAFFQEFGEFRVAEVDTLPHV